MTDPIKIINKSDLKKRPKQEKIWDSIANPWKTYVVKKIPFVVEFLKGKKGKIIDLGCGNGRNMIVNDNLEYYGVDFSKVQLMHAKKLVKQDKINVHLFKSRADKLDKKKFRNKMFDYGLFIATLHCLETPLERKNSLLEFYRVLKFGAEGLISVWNSEDKRFAGYEKEIYMSWKEEGVPYMRFYYLYDKKELLDLIKSVGFKVLKIYGLREHDRFSKKNLVIKIKK